MRKGLACLENMFPNGVAKCRQTLERTLDSFVVTEDSIAKQVAPLFPPPKGRPLDEEDLRAADLATARVDQDVEFSIAAVQKQLNMKRKDCAPGMSGLSARVVKAMWYRASDDQRESLCLLLSLLGNAHLPRTWTRFSAELANLRGVPILKPKGGVRPVGVAEILVTLSNGILNAARIGALASVSGGNLAVGVKGGAEAMGHAIQAALAADPSLVALAFDVENAFGSMARRILVEELVRLINVEGKVALIPVLRNVVAMIRAGMRITFKCTSGGGIISIPLLEGIFQGGPLCSALYAIVNAALIRRVRARIAASEGITASDAAALIVISFADDTHFVVPVHMVDAVITSMKAVMAEGTAGCKVEKTVPYCPSRSGPVHEQLVAVCDKHNIVIEGFPYRDLPAYLQGTTVCGLSIGTHDFTTRAMQAKMAKAIAIVDKIVSIVEFKEVALNRKPVETSLQAALLLLRLIPQARFEFFTRVNPPAVTRTIGRLIDLHVYGAVSRILHARATDSVLVSEAGPAAESRKERLLETLLELPTCHGGAGFHPVGGAAADAAYLSSFASASNLVRSLVGHVVLQPRPPGSNANPLLQPFLPQVTAAVRAAAQSAHLDLQSSLPLESRTATSPAVEVCLNLINNPENIAAVGASGLQAAVTKGRNMARRNSLIRQDLPSALHRLRFIEQACPIAAAWLSTVPRRGRGNWMPDAFFVAAFRHLLFLHPCPAMSNGVRVTQYCAACFVTQSTSSPFNDVHSLICKAAAPRAEHDSLRDAVHNFIQEAIPSIPRAQLSSETEPAYANIFRARMRSAEERVAAALPRSVPQASNLTQGDLIVTGLRNPDAPSRESILIDFRLVSPPASLQYEPPFAPIAKDLQADHFIKMEETQKRFEFNVFVHLEPNSGTTFLPFVISRSGRLGADADHVISHIVSLIDSHGASDASVHSTRQNLIDRVSIALQSGMGAKILRATDLHRKYLPLMVARQAAARAVQGAAAGGAALTPHPSLGGAGGAAGSLGGNVSASS
jgi:hypothetical protein